MFIFVTAFWKQACEYVMDVRRSGTNRKTMIMGRKTSIYDDTPLAGKLSLWLKVFN